jgi:hypothetical protein
MCGRLEQKTLKTTLPMENVILAVIVKTSPLELQGLINGAFASLPNLRLFTWFRMFGDLKGENSSYNKSNSSPCNLGCDPSHAQ